MPDVIDVRTFGAIGDGRSHPLSALGEPLETLVDLPRELLEPWNRALAPDDEQDWLGIQRAIVHAHSLGPEAPDVLIPAGRYLLTRPIIAGVDGLVLRGTEDTVLLIDLPKSTPAHERFGGILAQAGHPAELVTRLRIADLQLRYVRAGPMNIAGVGVAACRDFEVENVAVFGDGTGMHDSATNGLACSYPESTGFFRNCLADGVSKPGFYVAAGHDVVLEGCIARRCLGTDAVTAPEFVDELGSPIVLNLAGKCPGIGTANAARVVVRDCRSYDNDGPGLQITNIGALEVVTIPRSEFDAFMTAGDGGGLYQAYLGRFANELRYYRLPSKPTLTLDADGWLDVDGGSEHRNYVFVPTKGTTDVRVAFVPRPGSDIRVDGGNYLLSRHNAGILMGTNLVGVGTRRVEILGATCTGNAAGPGISASSTRDLLIEDCVTSGNQVGIVLSDVASIYPQSRQTERVSVNRCHVVNNSNVGLAIRSAHDVTVSGSRIASRPHLHRFQDVWFSVRVDDDGSGSTTRHPSTGVMLQDIDLSVTDLGEEVAGSNPVASGRFELRGAGPPPFNIAAVAPAGSSYLDVDTGGRYQLRDVDGTKKWARRFLWWWA